MRSRIISILFSLMVVAVGFAQSKKPITNDDVVQMVKAGFTEQTVVGAIKANDTAFDTSVQALMALKNSGVSQPIIDAMLSSEALKRTGSMPSNQAAPAAAAMPPASAAPPNPLLQQAEDLEKQANEAAARAQELEQKAQNSGSTGFGGILRTKYSIQAKRWRGKEKEYRQQAQHLREQAGVSEGPHQAGQAGAATDYQILDNEWCSLKYPKDWKSYSSLNAVVLSPEPQPADHSGTNASLPQNGAYFSALHLGAYVVFRNNQLTRADFQGLIDSLKLNDLQAGRLRAWGSQLTDASPMTINGRPAQAAEFTRFTNEHSWFVAILPPGHGFGHGDWFTFYIEFLAPEQEFEARRPIFEKIAHSIILKDIGLPKCGPGIRPGATCHE
jgi:hypothetical protein